MHFRVAVGQYFPFVRLGMENGILNLSGPIGDSFKLLTNRVNFTYTLHRHPHDVWGIKGPNGWTGMLGMISRNEVDLALGPFTLNYGRSSAFKTSVPMYVDNVEILVPALEWKMSLFNILTVLNYEVWIGLFISIFILSLIMSISNKCGSSCVKLTDGFFKHFWDTISTLLQQGRLQRPKGNSLVILNVFWMLMAFVVTYLFSGMLLTNLVVRKAHKIDSMEDLIATGDMQPIIEYHSSLHSAFRDGETEVFRTVYKRISENPTQCFMTFVNMSIIGMDLVSSGSFSLLTEGMALRHFLLKHIKDGLPCNFRLAKNPLYPLWKVIAFGETFPQKWINRINTELRHNFESGWFQQKMIDEFSGYTQCIFEGNSKVQSLQLEHTKGTFILLVMGCTASTVVLFSEVYFKCTRTERRQRPHTPNRCLYPY